MAIEGTGIKAPSKEASRMAGNFGASTPVRNFGGKILPDFGAGRIKNVRPKPGFTLKDVYGAKADTTRPNFFSPDGGAFDERNNVQIADSRTGVPQPLSLPGSPEYKQELKQYEESIRSDYPGIDRYGVDELQNLTEEGQKRLEDSYNIYRDYNYERNPLKYQQGIDFSKKEEKKPSFVERTKQLAGNIFNTVTGTQSAAASEMPTVIPSARPSATQFSSKNLDAARDTSFSSYVRGGGEGQERGSVSTSTPKQTVASLPSDYKQTEARAFAKSKAIKSAKKNPNTEVSIGDKGQAKVKAVQKTRKEAGPKARTAEGNKARVKQNARARAQAAAYNRKISGEKPKSAKERAQASAKARRAAGPNRKMSDGQKTRAQAGPSARTAQGNRARVKSNARKRAQAAARRRRACDIFLKHDISPLTNMNLIKDDLAEVAYFVKEIQK